MRSAVVKDGVVVNVVEAPDGFTVPGADVVPSATASEGWVFDGATFSPPAQPDPAAPSDIHAAWMRAALAEAGQLDAVNTAVASHGPVKQALWDFATSISRADPDVVAIASALSIDLAALFTRADEIRSERGL